MNNNGSRPSARRLSPLDSRIDYLKINFNPSEIAVFYHKTHKVNDFFSDLNLSFNTNELFRVIALNIDDDELMSVLSRLYRTEGEPLFIRLAL